MWYGVGFFRLVSLNVVCYSMVVVVWFGMVGFGLVVLYVKLGVGSALFDL